MNNNKLIAAAITLTIVLVATISFNIVIDQIADRVIEKLKRDYVPGPYQPGFDPDKVDPNAFNTSQSIPLTLNELVDYPSDSKDESQRYWTEQVFNSNDHNLDGPVTYSSRWIKQP